MVKAPQNLEQIKKKIKKYTFSDKKLRKHNNLFRLMNKDYINLDWEKESLSLREVYNATKDKNFESIPFLYKKGVIKREKDGISKEDVIFELFKREIAAQLDLTIWERNRRVKKRHRMKYEKQKQCQIKVNGRKIILGKFPPSRKARVKEIKQFFIKNNFLFERFSIYKIRKFIKEKMLYGNINSLNPLTINM